MEVRELLEAHLNDKAAIYPVKCLAKQALALLKQPTGEAHEVIELLEESLNWLEWIKQRNRCECEINYRCVRTLKQLPCCNFRGAAFVKNKINS